MSASESRSPDWRCRTKALLFIALLMFDMPGARAVRSDLLDDAGMSEVGTSLRGGDKIEDPFEQYVEHRGFVQEHLDNFGAYTGLIPEHRKEAFKKAVSYIISDDEIFQAAQFAVCVRTSPTPHEDYTPDDMEVRCTPAVDILDTTEGRTSARRVSLYNVYNELLDLVDKVEEPKAPAFNLPWTQNDEHEEKDLNFAEYFHAYANLKAASFNKPNLGRENDIIKDVLRFPMKFQFKKADGQDNEEEEDSDEEQEWPPYLPRMESRYMLCFGELAAPGQMDFSGEAVKKACTGFWNRDITKDAIAGLGADLRKENMEQTMFRVRSEILFGKKEGEGDQSLERTFHLLAGAGSDARSARGVAEAIARLVRERIAVTGISCPRCVAEALGISSAHDQAASLTETAEGSSALVEANESAIALGVAARSQPPPVFAMPPVAPVAPVVHHAAPAFQVITPGLVNPAGQHVAVQAAGHAHIGHLAHGVVQAHANFGGVVTHYVPVTEVLNSGLKGGWHFITHGGHQVIKMKAAGAKSCMGLFHLKGSAAVTTDIGLKLAMKHGVLCLATQAVTHGTAAGTASVTPWAAISAALTVHVFGITIPPALVVSAVVLVAFATHFGVKWISDHWKNRMTQRKLKKWQLLMRSSAITQYWVARA